MSFEPTRSTDPYNRYRTEEIQKNRSGGDSGGSEPPQKNIPAILYFLLTLFQKITKLFEATSEAGLTTPEEIAFLQHLSMFKNVLNTLKREDQSQDAAFLNSLSEAWNLLIKDGSRLRPVAPLSILFFHFIDEIQHYPQTQEHTLGYYLTECANHKWLPFPYMELIYALHSIHQAHPELSHLTSWVNQIDQIILSIKSREN